jgi:hypothetical protein
MCQHEPQSRVADGTTTSRFGPPPGKPKTTSAPKSRTPSANAFANPLFIRIGRYSTGSAAPRLDEAHSSRRHAGLLERAMISADQEETMADIKQGRWTAEIEGDFVVFIIGARVNSKWQVFKALNDLGGRKGLNYMLKYLTEHPEKGMLGYQSMGFASVQYWRSFEHLEAFAKDTDDRTSSRGESSGSASGRTVAPGSGTRPTSSATENTRPSTATCRRGDSARRLDWYRSPNQSAPGNG